MPRVVAAGVAVLALAACTGDDAPDDAARAREPAPTVPSTSTTTTTEAPLAGEPLVVVDQGLSSYPDPFDPTASLGGYGVVLANPNPDVLAAGVRVVTRILDDAGTELLVDRALLNAVMPGQQMAVGRTLIEPIEAPSRLEVTVEVAAWLRPGEPGGALTVDGVVTEPEENGGAVTRFTVHSDRPEAKDGVDVTAVYRAADGRILAAESTTIATVPGRADTPGQIRLLSPIPDLAATDVYVGRGIAAQTTG